MLTSPAEALATLFGVADRLNLSARHNIAPTQEVALVRQEAEGRRLRLARWGLIPAWAKAPFAKGGIAAATLINARADTIAEKPAFRGAFRGGPAQGRGLMPADGFYEWREDVTPKQPYRIGLAGFPPFAIAALWERWQGRPTGAITERAAGEEEVTILSCALITTDASPAIAHIHHRAPVILAQEAWSTWLDPATESAALLKLLQPTDQPLAFHPVSLRVNSVRADDPGLLAPIPEPARATGEAEANSTAANTTADCNPGQQLSLL